MNGPRSIMKVSIVLRRGNKIKLRIVTRIHVKWIRHVCFITTNFGKWLNEVVNEFSVGREMTVWGDFMMVNMFYEKSW